jgi:hypothetical protein
MKVHKMVRGKPTGDAAQRKAERDAIAAKIEEFKQPTEKSLRDRFAKIEAQADRRRKVRRQGDST